MWIKLEPSLLKTHLAEPEIAALASVAKPVEVERILADECENVAEAWRGRLRKFIRIDKRKGFVPTELLVFILAHVRYSSFTRLPNMETLLDDLRVKEWEKAMDILDDPRKFDIEEPEEEEAGNGLVPYVFKNPRVIKVESF